MIKQIQLFQRIRFFTIANLDLGQIIQKIRLSYLMIVEFDESLLTGVIISHKVFLQKLKQSNSQSKVLNGSDPTIVGL